MSEDRRDELDSFWDIQSLLPRGALLRPTSKSTDTVEINNGDSEEDGGTVIERFIPPHFKNELEDEFNECFSYAPENSLVHKVTVYKQKGTYKFYEKFVFTAKKLKNVQGMECDYEPFFSYSPQYDQLSKGQFCYYLWWRENVRRGVYLQTNNFYIALYLFELINASEEGEYGAARDAMLAVIENYADMLRGAVSQFMRWVVEFSLIHGLQPPENISHRLISSAETLKEYFIRIDGNTPEGWAGALLDYCCSYDWKKSKFYVDENRELYDVHIPRMLTEVVKNLSGNGKILSELPFGDCSVRLNAFNGAVCSHENKYMISVEYCSFSRSHELRFLIGDAVKYAENKIRAYLSVKSRLTVYSLSSDLRDVIDEYFCSALPPRAKRLEKVEERHEYDVLYDLPKRELSLDNAARIELEAWSTTRELVADFDCEETESVPMHDTAPEPVQPEAEEERENGDFGIYREALQALKRGDSTVLNKLAAVLSKPVEALADEINELAVNAFGDIIIEDTEHGYAVIEDYSDIIE